MFTIKHFKRIISQLLLFLVSLEIFLRLGGFAFFLIQKQTEHAVNLDPSHFRILCIGDSISVYDPYAAVLQQIVRRAEQSFSVDIFNKSFPGATSKTAYELIAKIISEYKPQLIILLVGMNDHEIPAKKSEPTKERFQKNLLSQIIGSDNQPQDLRVWKMVKGVWTEIVSAKTSLVEKLRKIKKHCLDVNLRLKQRVQDSLSEIKKARFYLWIRNTANSSQKPTIGSKPEDSIFSQGLKDINDGYYPEALTRFKEIAAFPEALREKGISIADLLLRGQQPGLAIEWLAYAIAHQDLAIFHLKLAECYKQIGRQDLIGAEFRKAIIASEENEFMRTINILMNIGGLQASGEWLSAAGRHPVFSELKEDELLSVADAFIERGRPDLAEEWLGYGLKHQDLISFHLKLADCYQKAGRMDLVASEFRKAIIVSNDDALISTADRFIRNNKLNMAKEWLHQAIAFQNRATFHLKLAECHRLENRIDLMGAEYEKAVSASKEGELLANSLLWAAHLMSQEQYELAAKVLDEQLRTGRAVGKERFGIYVNLKKCYEKLGNQEGAKAVLSELQKMNLAGEIYKKAIHQLAFQNKVVLVAVQYPMLDVEQLKQEYNYAAENIVYVDNKTIFEDAVRGGVYLDIFRDANGGNFGHLTERGSALLASNVYQSIFPYLKAYSNKGQILQTK